MRGTVIHWSFLGVSTLLSAFACSGRNLNDVGELNSVGGADNSGAGNANSSAAAGKSGSGPNGDPCPYDGLCDAAGTSSVSSGGRTGVLSADAGAGGEGGDDGAAAPLPKDGSLVCTTCQTVALAKDIRGAAANDQKVFWIEYGTNDRFNNYNGDGRLLARDLVGGATSVLADSLPGPQAVSLSSQYIYLVADQGAGAGHFQVLRLPLVGGSAQVVQTPPSAASYSTYEVFAFAAGSEYWTWGGSVYRLGDDGATPETFVAAADVAAISADSTTLYYSTGLSGTAGASVWSKPLAGGDPTQLAPNAFGAQVDGDFLYGVDGSYLTRMPIGGGAWKRVGRAAGYHLAIDGDAYFTDLPNWTAGNLGARRIMQESFSTSSTNVALATAAATDGDGEGPYWKAFAYSRVGVFFADNKGLYLVPPAAP